MARLEDILWLAKNELACPRCNNQRSVMVRGELDECPECHGEQRNPHTIRLLEILTRTAVLRPEKTAVADAAGPVSA